MEAKLIKDHDDYHLVNNEQFVIGTIDESILSCTDKYKLSLKNCEEIERGYNLDELAFHNSLSYTWLETNERDKALMSKYSIEGFKAGFQKALEILGDKKFNEDDMKKAIYIAWEGGDLASTHIIESLQQTEWDVEVEMKDSIALDGHTIIGTEPTLDTDGCLRLKKI